MATLSQMIILWLAIHCFTNNIHVWPTIMTELKKEKGYQGIRTI